MSMPCHRETQLNSERGVVEEGLKHRERRRRLVGRHLVTGAFDRHENHACDRCVQEEKTNLAAAQQRAQIPDACRSYDVVR
jgi:hypothetical protein